MNLAPAWCEVFRAAGWTAVHWTSVGPSDATDATLMRWAVDHDHVVFTHDLDFSAILAASGGRAPSVIQLRAQDVFPDMHGVVLMRLLREHEAQLQEGAVLTYDTQRMRVRILPLR